MPEYIVVRCYSCRIHQVIQENKKGKFACKICTSNQSVKAVLDRSSSSRELRSVVQELNMRLRDEDLEKEAARRAATLQPAAPQSVRLAAPQNPVPASRWGQFCEETPHAPKAPQNVAAPQRPVAASQWGQFCEETARISIASQTAAAAPARSVAASRWGQFCEETPQ